MSLITATEVKDKLPKWQTYCTREDGLKTADQMLDIAIDDAEQEFLSHTTVTDSTITDPQKAMVIKIAKYNCWKFMHGDSEFKQKPAIVKDYEAVKKRLNDGAVGSSNITLTAKTREFQSGKWFHDTEDENATSS